MATMAHECYHKRALYPMATNEDNAEKAAELLIQALAHRNPATGNSWCADLAADTRTPCATEQQCLTAINTVVNWIRVGE